MILSRQLQVTPLRFLTRYPRQFYEQGKMSPLCRIPFLKCITHLASPRLLPAVVEDLKPGDILVAMAQDEVLAQFTLSIILILSI